MTAVERIEAWALRFPLAQELRLGPMVIRERHYVVVRVTAADGRVAGAYALSRGAPVDIAVTDLVAPGVMGAELASVDDAWRRWEGVFAPLGMTGILARAVSLVDIALWDLAAQGRGEPLWRLLGSARTASEVMLVEGYPLAGESAEDFADRLAERAEAGYTWLKIANIPDVDAMTDRLRATRERCPDVNLVIDIAWAWRNRGVALEAARRWREFDLRWIEDPAPADDAAFIHDLRVGAPAAIAVGDEVSDQLRIRGLLDADAVDVLRVDALAIGGVTGFLRSLDEATTAGLPVSPHIYPEVHRHLAFAFKNVGPVETYGTSGSFDRALEFVAVEDGPVLSAPGEPGVGIEFDWQAVELAAYRTSEVRA